MLGIRPEEPVGLENGQWEEKKPKEGKKEAKNKGKTPEEKKAKPKMDKPEKPKPVEQAVPAGPAVKEHYENPAEAFLKNGYN